MVDKRPQASPSLFSLSWLPAFPFQIRSTTPPRPLSIWCTHILQAIPTRLFLCAFHFSLQVCFSLQAASISEGKCISCSFFVSLFVVLNPVFQTYIFTEELQKLYQAFSYTSYPISPNANILHNHSMILNNRKLTLVQYFK